MSSDVSVVLLSNKKEPTRTTSPNMHECPSYHAMQKKKKKAAAAGGVCGCVYKIWLHFCKNSRKHKLIYSDRQPISTCQEMGVQEGSDYKSTKRHKETLGKGKGFTGICTYQNWSNSTL